MAVAEPTERDLIPLGQPHGERQDTEAAMRQAQLPLGTASPPADGAAVPQPSNRGPSRVPDMLQARAPRQAPDINTLLNPPAAPPPVTRAERLAGMRDQANNPLVRAIIERMLGDT